MIRVLVVNAIRLMCNVITAVLEDESDIEVVGTATTVDETIAQVPRCDVLLVSSGLPDDGALRITQAVKQANLPAKVLIIGLAESKEEILQFIEAGAASYVLQDESVDDLLAKIRTAYRDEALVSPDIAAALIARVSELAELSDKSEDSLDQVAELTPREREILVLVEQGLSNQQIAERLVVEVGTVKNHIHSILQKLNVDNRREAAKYADVTNEEH